METAQSLLSHDRPLKPMHMSLVGGKRRLVRAARRVSELIDSLLLLAGTSHWLASSLSPEAKPFRSTLIGIVKPLAALDRRQASVAARRRAAPGA